MESLGRSVTIDQEQVEAAVDAQASGYERLVLIVGPPGSGKSSVLRDAAKGRGWPVTNLGLELAQRMLELPVQQRPARALDTIRGLLDDLDSDVACLDNIELLFEPSLQLDPLGLLQSLSRQKTLVVAWPGIIAGDEGSPRLAHAERHHPEYRDYSARGLVLLSVSAEE
jgi:ABC-type thiamine transport system ATPase subunit